MSERKNKAKTGKAIVKLGLDEIRNLPMICSSSVCDWRGTVYDCEDDIDGEGSLGCPVCLSIAEEVIDNEFKKWLKEHCNDDCFREYNPAWDEIALSYLLWKSRTIHDSEYFFLRRLVSARMERKI